MAGCGYVCPLCEGSGVNDAGNPCDYCTDDTDKNSEALDWIQEVHENNSCSD